MASPVATGVTPDIICLAKAMGGGLPCGAIGATTEVMQLVEDDVYEQVGTFNGNPLTMAAAKATLTEILTPDAYEHLDHLVDPDRGRCEPRSSSAAASRGTCRHSARRAAWSSRPSGSVSFRDFVDYDDRWGHGHWLWQHNRGVFLPPWGKCEQWTLSVQHTDGDVDRYLENLDSFCVAVTNG